MCVGKGGGANNISGMVSLVVSFIDGGNRVPGEYTRPATSH